MTIAEGALQGDGGPDLAVLGEPVEDVDSLVVGRIALRWRALEQPAQVRWGRYPRRAVLVPPRGPLLLFFAGTSPVVLFAYFVVSSQERSLAIGTCDEPQASTGAAPFCFCGVLGPSSHPLAARAGDHSAAFREPRLRVLDARLDHRRSPSIRAT